MPEACPFADLFPMTCVPAGHKLAQSQLSQSPIRLRRLPATIPGGYALTSRTLTQAAAAALPLALALVVSGAQAQSQPTPGGTVRFAIAEESRGLDPLTAHRRFSEAAIHIHDSLGLFDVSNKPFPSLATEWSSNPDSTEYTIKLRNDVVFHDGTKFNAESVKAHFTRVFDKQYCCNNGHQYMNPYTGTDVIDEFTIKVKFSKPWGAFAFYMGMLDVTGIPSNAGWTAKGMQMNREPIGAGPFKFVSWTPQSNIKLARNADYKWGSSMFPHRGAPFLDGLEVKFIANQATRTACLESGDCDIIKDPNFADMRRLTANPAFEVVKIPQTGMPFSFVFNTARFPTDNLAVRKAINLAIDREKINIAAYRGERRPLFSTLAPATPEFWPDAPKFITLNPAEARKTLTDAGAKDTNGDGVLELDGKPIEVDLYVFGNRDNNPSVIVAEAIQSDLKAIGIALKINVRPWDDQSVVAMKEEHSMINFDMPLPTASVLNVMFNSRETPRPGRYGMSFTYIQKGNAAVSAQLDQLLDAGDNAATFEDRKAKFQAAQKIIAENYLGVPIAQGFTTYVMVKRLKGVTYNNGGHAMFNAAYLEPK
jgi:peptide/nickel transport system substrate-binding protein